MKIVADAFIPYVEEYFSACGDLILQPGRSISCDDVKDAEILLVRSITQVNKSLLANSRVKFVGSITAGADHLDEYWLKEAGIDYALATGFNAPPVADYVVSVLAALMRGKQLTGRKAAVIGVGNVGKLVAERLRLLQFDVLLCDPFRSENEADFESIALNAIQDVDVISLHVPLTKQGSHPTYHFLDKHFLQKQKDNCVLINASRGAVIDTDTLLLYGSQLQWCFDVWEHEPNINQTVLARAQLATPHIAGYSVQAKMRGVRMIYETACKRNYIMPNASAEIIPPSQTLSFAGNVHHWQDIVLSVFNPIEMTAMMRTQLLSNHPHESFDHMRNQFHYRHEFSATHLKNINIKADDSRILKHLGFVF